MSDKNNRKSKSSFGFLKVAVAVPEISPADTETNAEKVIASIKEAENENVGLLVFPLATLTGITCGDLFFTSTLQTGQKVALDQVIEATRELKISILLNIVVLEGGGLNHRGLFLRDGRILRQLAIPPSQRQCSLFHDREQTMPLMYEDNNISISIFNPSRFSSNLLDYTPGCISVYLSDEPFVMGTPSRLRELARVESEKFRNGFIAVSPGAGESVGESVYGGHCVIGETGQILCELASLDTSSTMMITDIDCAKIKYKQSKVNIDSALLQNQSFDCMDSSIFSNSCSFPPEDIGDITYSDETTLARKYSPTPFLPQDDEGCAQVFQIQAHALARRLRTAAAHKSVLGISGGLDSTLALLVCFESHKLLDRPASDIVTVTMPCFGTSAQTYSSALALMESLGTDMRNISIADSVSLHFKDIGHDASNYNVVYENAQARERTQILMDISNMESGLLVGTGDLSEAALGWCTYNGDHMSMYNVNAGVPKTLVRKLVEWYCQNSQNSQLSAALVAVLETPISPELLPTGEGGRIAQITEDNIGPYILHDFFLYHTLDSAMDKEKLCFIAYNTFKDRWDYETIQKWQQVFYKRFFSQQFKRNCCAEGPQVTALSLSPRGGFTMASDINGRLWTK